MAAVSPTHAITVTVNAGSGARISSNQTIPGDREINEGVQVAASTTDHAVTYSCPTAKLQSFLVVSDQDVQMNVNAIHSGAPILTKNLKAGIPWFWNVQLGDANPFSADITGLYFTNAGTTVANVTIKSLANN